MKESFRVDDILTAIQKGFKLARDEGHEVKIGPIIQDVAMAVVNIENSSFEVTLDQFESIIVGTVTMSIVKQSVSVQVPPVLSTPRPFPPMNPGQIPPIPPRR